MTSCAFLQQQLELFKISHFTFFEFHFFLYEKLPVASRIFSVHIKHKKYNLVYYFEQWIIKQHSRTMWCWQAWLWVSFNAAISMQLSWWKSLFFSFIFWSCINRHSYIYSIPNLSPILIDSHSFPFTFALFNLLYNEYILILY